MSPSLRSSLFVLALASGCASSPTAVRPDSATATAEKPAPSAVESKPQGLSLGDALAREIEPLPVKDLTIAEGEFTAQVEAKGEPVVTPHEGFFHVEIPVGTVTPMSCFVYPKHLDTGGALMGFLGSVTEKVQLVQLRTSEIAAVGIDPVVILHATYVAETEQGKQQGVLKVGARSARGNSVLCYHDEPGYSKAFSRMLQGFARTLKPATPQSAPSRYGELQVVKFRDVPVGFERRRLLDAKAGGRVDEVISMMLMPRSATEMVAQDSSKVVVTDASGRINTIRSSESSGGETSVDMTILRSAKKTNEYTYEGTLSGKAVKGTFKSSDKNGLPGDELLEEFMRQKMFTGGTPSYAYEQYDPELDLTKPMKLTVTPKNPAERLVTIHFGAMTIDGNVDQHGLVEKAQLTMGPATLTMERVATVGTP